VGKRPETPEPRLPGLRRYQQPRADPAFAHLRRVAGIRDDRLPHLDGIEIIAGPGAVEALGATIQRLAPSLRAAYDPRIVMTEVVAASRDRRTFAIASTLVERFVAHLAEIDAIQVAMSVADPRELDRALFACLRRWRVDSAPRRIRNDFGMARDLEAESTILIDLLGVYDDWQACGGTDSRVPLAVAEVLEAASRGWCRRRNDERRHLIPAQVALLGARGTLPVDLARAWSAVTRSRQAVHQHRAELAMLGGALDEANEVHRVAMAIVARVRETVVVGREALGRLRALRLTDQDLTATKEQLDRGVCGLTTTFGATLSVTRALLGEV
jgi:hypothetical protein